mmetsp:Transcript_77947/g.156018  ORF Transcript_77947/g.156018 Transcript_77947/m.156018 type:complete len:321 (+) Transcript_77947:62-1024(+)
MSSSRQARVKSQLLNIVDAMKLTESTSRIVSQGSVFVALTSLGVLVISHGLPFLKRRPRRSFVASLVESLNGEGGALWLNLGFWREKTSYPEAAEALACAVASKARMQPGALVVDVGCGMGESMLCWQRNFGASLQSIGVNNSMAEVVEARLRGIAVIQGDASALPFADGSADVVIALDSAYHFRYRRDFLIETARVLRSGGTFGAADIINSDDHGRVGTLWRRRFVSAISGIPLENISGGTAQYEADLASAGLSVRVSIDDVTAEVVTDGFAMGDWTRNRQLKVVAWLIGFLIRQGGLRYVLVTATKEGVPVAVEQKYS